MPILFVAITAMLIQQTVATTAKVGIPSLIPAVARELHFDSELVLLYTAFYAFISLLCMAGCGGRHTTLWRTSNKPVWMCSHGTWPSARAVGG